MSIHVQLHIGGKWLDGESGKHLPILNPASAQTIGTVACAGTSDLERAVAAAERGFQTWSRIPAIDRYRIMRKAAQILESRADDIARTLTTEQGKPLAQARLEVMVGVDVIDWCAEEARRTYGRIIPARGESISQMVIKEPVGPVAAFSPWNFPINQAVRKISAALAAGCSIIIKGPEETPGSCAALVQTFIDAGVPPGVVNLVFGVPSEISGYLIAHPVIRKISFTGSTSVGKQLAMLAGQHMKRMTMELGGHAPVLVFNDADIGSAVQILSAQKIRNAGQVCTAPTRFLVQEGVFGEFSNAFTAALDRVHVADGLDPASQMGPLVRERRVDAMDTFVSDAVAKGAEILTGGKRMRNDGYFFEPTVLTNLSKDARIMNEEPFGPIASIVSFRTLDDAITEANRLPYGLAAYGYTKSLHTASELGGRLQAGVVSINHNGVAIPETPFGGIKDSGYGSEGGIEAVEAYLNTKFVTQRAF